MTTPNNALRVVPLSTLRATPTLGSALRRHVDVGVDASYWARGNKASPPLRSPALPRSTKLTEALSGDSEKRPRPVPRRRGWRHQGRHRGRTLGCPGDYVSAQAPSLAEDLAPERWLPASQRLSSFRGGEVAFRGWLFTIGRCRLIQHWRDAGRQPFRPVRPENLVERAGPGDTEAEAVEATGARAAARVIAQALPPDQAGVVGACRIGRRSGGRDPGQASGLGAGAATQGPASLGGKFVSGSVDTVSVEGDWNVDMPGYVLHEVTADRLLSGGLSPRDAPNATSASRSVRNPQPPTHTQQRPHPGLHRFGVAPSAVCPRFAGNVGQASPISPAAVRNARRRPASTRLRLRPLAAHDRGG